MSEKVFCSDIGLTEAIHLFETSLGGIRPTRIGMTYNAIERFHNNSRSKFAHQWIHLPRTIGEMEGTDRCGWLWGADLFIEKDLDDNELRLYSESGCMKQFSFKPLKKERTMS